MVPCYDAQAQTLDWAQEILPQSLGLHECAFGSSSQFGMVLPT